MRLPRTILILSASAGVAAGLYGVAEAAAPTDPQAASQQPLQIMRVGEGLDHAARPLVDVPVLVADTGLDLDHPDLASRLLIPPPAVTMVVTPLDVVALPPVTVPTLELAHSTASEALE